MPGVVQLVDALSVGGAEQLAVRIANGLARRGRRSCVYALRHDGPLRDRLDPAVGYRLLDLHRPPVGRPLAFVRGLSAGRRLLTSALGEDGISIVQSHLPTANFWNLLLAVRGDAGTVPTIHNNLEFSYGADGLKGALNRQAYRLMLRRCGTVVGCSAEVRESLLETLGLGGRIVPRLVAVPNGVDVPEPRDEAARRAVRQRHGIGPDARFVLAAGRLTEQKNFALLVDAVAGLKDSVPGLQMIIAGDGELRADLERQVAASGLAETVSLPGNLADLGELMQAADVFALPSRFEGLPLVLLEAMAAGTAVVGTRIKGVVDVVEDGTSGLICESGDATDLARCLANLLADDDLRRRYGAAARARVEATYSLDRVLDQLEDIYRTVSERRQKGVR